MMSWWREAIQAIQAIRPADLLDVAVLSLFLLWLLHRIRGTAYGRLWTVLILLVLGLAATRRVGMYLTELLLQLLLIAVAVALIVVFQEEIRRFFERIALPASKRKSSSGGLGDLVSDVVEAVFSMASARTGALIVFKGREPLERLLSGGIALDGRLSQALVSSIFQPDSPGHDGAAIVEGRSISKFAVHLPLVKDPPSDTRLGTRHAAALGVSARSDALVVVVSEERGEVSLAEDGSLQTVGSAALLQSKLEEFLRRHEPERTRAPAAAHALQTSALALLSVVLAGLFWFLFSQPVETVQRSVDVPIEYRNLPENFSLESPTVTEARVALSGSNQAFAALAPEELSVALDVSRPIEGEQELAIRAEDVELPSGLEIRNIEPRAVSFVVEELIEVRLPVSVTTERELRNGLELTTVEAEPSEVSLWAPRSRASEVESVETEPIDLGVIEASETRRVPLVAPKGTRFSEASSEVEVRIVVARNPGAPKARER